MEKIRSFLTSQNFKTALWWILGPVIVAISWFHPFGLLLGFCYLASAAVYKPFSFTKEILKSWLRTVEKLFVVSWSVGILISGFGASYRIPVAEIIKSGALVALSTALIILICMTLFVGLNAMISICIAAKKPSTPKSNS